MVGHGFTRREDILQDTIPPGLLAVHRLNFILVRTDFGDSTLDVAVLGIPGPHQLGVPHGTACGGTVRPLAI